MLLHDLRLALLSFKRNPALTALMVGAIAAGIGAAMVTIALYHAQSGNPIWWKEDRLYAVAVDARSADPVAASRFNRHPEEPPTQLTFLDAQALFRSAAPEHKVMMYKITGVLDAGRTAVKPFPVLTRLTTADFFTMFDVPFLYGNGWSNAADQSPDAVIVLSRRTNDKAFGGINSVGRTVSFRGHEYRVVGVLDRWLPKPKFYDVMDGAFDVPEDVYLPFRWGVVQKLRSFGPRGGCLKTQVEEFPDTDCVIQFWAELRDERQRIRFTQFMDAYVRDQKQLGRFPRPLNNRLMRVSAWFERNDVVKPETGMLVALALMFLAVCVLNTLGLMLAKFLGWARVSGLRRALGASRGDILRQHLTEAVVIGLVGGVVGLAISALGLWALRAAFFIAEAGNAESAAMMRHLTQLDFTMVIVALGVSLLAGIVAGLYPAWRICRGPPTAYLKM